MLEHCLESLIGQDLASPYEIIVVDDGSTDGTAAAVRRMRPRADARGVRLRVEKQAGEGLNAARNRGTRSAAGPLVCLVDDDVDAPAGWLAALVHAANRHPQAEALGGPIKLRIEGREPRHCRGDRLPETALDRGPELVWDQKLWGANLAFRTTTFERIGPFDETLGVGDEEEWEDRLLASGGHTLYVPDAWLWHRRTPDELGHRYLLARSFRIGYSHVPYRLAFGHRVTVRSEMWHVVRGTGHAMLFGCFYGLLRAARHLGATLRLLELRRAGSASSNGTAASHRGEL